MKTHIPLFSSLLILTPFAPRYASAQEETKPAAGDIRVEKEVEENEVSVATGTIFSLDLESIGLTPEKSTIPLVFEITTATPLVDELDKKVAKDLVRTGIGATVYYITVGEKLVASKIVVTRKTLAGSGPQDPTGATRKRAELTETKEMKDEAARSKALAVEGGGTLMGFEQIIAVRQAGEAAMTQYTVNSSTMFVDSAGNPVPPHVVRTGAGLKVQYVEDAGRKIATRVTVQTMPAWVREGMLAAESGTTIRGPAAPPAVTANGNQTTTGSLADGFLYPPVLSLPTGQPDATNNGIQPNQPNANQPSGNNQPNTNQPNTTQPNATNRPNTSPGRANTPGRNSNPSGSAQPSTPSATPGAK